MSFLIVEKIRKFSNVCCLPVRCYGYEHLVSFIGTCNKSYFAEWMETSVLLLLTPKPASKASRAVHMSLCYQQFAQGATYRKTAKLTFSISCTVCFEIQLNVAYYLMLLCVSL